jgi:hypothetical protein
MTPHMFVQQHGDPIGWCTAEFDEWLAVCDEVRDTVQRLERAAAVAAGGASGAEVAEAFRPGGER